MSMFVIRHCAWSVTIHTDTPNWPPDMQTIFSRFVIRCQFHLSVCLPLSHLYTHSWIPMSNLSKRGKLSKNPPAVPHEWCPFDGRLVLNFNYMYLSRDPQMSWHYCKKSSNLLFETVYWENINTKLCKYIYGVNKHSTQGTWRFSVRFRVMNKNIILHVG